MVAMPDQRQRLDLKVAATSGGALVAGVVLAVLEALVAQPALLEGLPPVVRFLVIAAAPPLLVFLSGVAVPKEEPRPPECECDHTPRRGVLREQAPEPGYQPKHRTKHGPTPEDPPG